MGFAELLLTAAALSMDAFAVSVGIGLPAASKNKALTAGLYFGVSQAVMPLIGYMAATLFAEKIIAFDHWVAFGLLCFLGGKMIAGSRAQRPQEGGAASFGHAQMLTLAIATSIDALAVGVSFAFLRVSVAPAVLLIGAVTFALSFAGVKTGAAFGARLGPKAELAGGVTLILIGAKILLEHLEVLG